jgi:N-dimethylarginine dimethylaminohydrolase
MNVIETSREAISLPVRRPSPGPDMIARPAFLLNFPLSYSAGVPNNAWMQELTAEERVVDLDRAARQFLQLYHFLASEALVYVLPTPRGCTLQDLVFTANLGIVFEHLPGRSTVVLSNFASPPRRGETAVGLGFFQAMGYDVHVAPFHFEGEAELKHLHGNVYIGGYGMRSDRRTYEWMADAFDMRIVQVEETDPYLYHLDCTIFPITREDTLVCTEAFEEDELLAIEKVTNVIDVSLDDCYAGICNSVRLGNIILNASNVHELAAGTDDYESERNKNRKLEDLAIALGFEVAFFNLDEYAKGGGLLSCLAMHLNRSSYGVRLV